MIDPTKDGITHINIYSQGKTELGRMLSNFYRYSIETKDGQFNSVEGYWYWLGIEDCKEKEILRKLYGYTAKKTGNNLKAHFNSRFDDEFERKILNAIWYKARKNTHLFVPETSKLPLEHYYNFSGKIVNVKNKYLWMIDGIDKMRNYIIEKQKSEN
jgi:hypothetical protein